MLWQGLTIKVSRSVRGMYRGIAQFKENRIKGLAALLLSVNELCVTEQTIRSLTEFFV